MERDITLTVLVTDEATAVEVQAPTYNNLNYVRASGWAKKHPNDEPDATVGYDLAVARALRALAAKYEAEAVKAMEEPELSVITTDQAYFSSWLAQDRNKG